MYELEYLQTYTGELDPRDLNLAACFNSIEKHISQTEYQLKIRHPFAQNLKHITIKILNENIPHLIGLSKTHHLNLPITQPAIIFQKVKQQEENWTLQELIAADEGWFGECKGKLVGILFLYQVMNQIQITTYTTDPFKASKDHKLYRRIERDEVTYIFIKNIEGASFSFEFSATKSSPHIFIPRSLKLNDPIEQYLTPIEIETIEKLRIKAPKPFKKRKNKNL